MAPPSGTHGGLLVVRKYAGGSKNSSALGYKGYKYFTALDIISADFTNKE